MEESMSNFRKHAWSHLVICASALLAVAILFWATGNILASIAGFAILSLMGFSELYFLLRSDHPYQDERDLDNQRKAHILAYSGFWLCFVAWGTYVSLRYSSEGLVPIEFVAPIVIAAFWIVTVIRATAALVLDGRQS
jgi:hypothetical protein